MNITEFISKTYQLLAASLFLGAVGAYVGLGLKIGVIASIVALICLIGLIIGIRFVKTEIVKIAFLTTITFFVGLLGGPTIQSVLNTEGGAEVIGMAFLLTSIIFGGLSVFALKTKINFQNIGGYLMIALLTLIVASILNVFFGNSFIQLIISYFAALIFSVYIIHDTQNIFKGEYDSPAEAALSMFLNVWNLFMNLINILKGEK